MLLALQFMLYFKVLSIKDLSDSLIYHTPKRSLSYAGNGQ